MSVTLSARGAASLDGGPPLHAAASADAVVTLSVSVDNSYFVCWRSSHAGAAALAAVTLPLYVFGLPALTLWWLWRDPWVAAEARRSEATSTGEAYAPRMQRADDEDVVSCADAAGDPASSEVDLATPASYLDLRVPATTEAYAASFVEPDPLLGVFFYDYKPTAWYTKHIDLGLLLLLSLFRALLPRPMDLGRIVAKATIICTALLAACTHVLWVRPYLNADAWMGWVG